MKNSSAAQFHRHEDVQCAEGGGNHDEEVAGDDYLSMIADEGQPTLLRIGCARRSPGTQVLPHTAGRNANAEFQLQFVGALLSPGHIRRSYLSNQLAQALRQGRSSSLRGLPAPEQLKPSPVPSNESIGPDAPQSITPGEQLAESRHDPPRSIAGPVWPYLSLLEQCQLLPEEQILRCERASSPEAHGAKSKEIEQNQ